MKRAQKTIVISSLIAAGLLVPSLWAVSTSIWRVSTEQGFLAGELDNVVVTSTGEVGLGTRLSKIATEEIAIWSSLVAKDGSIYVGTGNQGTIAKLVGDKLETVYQGEDLVVTAMAQAPDGSIYGATLPDGRVIKVGTDGKSSVFCTLKDPYVWSIAVGPDGTVYAGTGEDGKIYKINPAGEATVLFDSKEDHVLSLAVANDGTLYAGTTYEGILYRIPPGGAPQVLQDFEENEVRSLYIRGNTLYLGTNKSKKFKPKAFVQRLKRSAEKAAEGTEERSPFQELFDGVVYRMNLQSGGPEKFFEFSKSYVIHIAADESGRILVATGDEGRVYRVKEDGSYTTFIDFKENQAMTLGVNASGKLMVVGTGNAGTVYRVDSGQAQKGSYLSTVLDAKFHSRWGSLEWIGEGKVSFQVRSGNTSKPDDFWSDWTPASDARTMSIASPEGRFLQFRATWESDPNALLRSVSVSYLTDNQRPRIAEFEVRSGEPDAAYKGQDPHSREIEFGWKSDDPDGDSLVFDLSYRNQEAGNWILINREGPIDKKKFNLDTTMLADGWYSFKLESSDKRANPTERSYKVSKVSEPVLVDNRKPDIVDLAVDKELRCEVLVEDSFSNIARFEYSIDGSEWHLLYPADSLFDRPKEQFKFPLGEIKPGVHTITVRAYDARGNVGTRSIEFTKQVG